MDEAADIKKQSEQAQDKFFSWVNQLKSDTKKISTITQFDDLTRHFSDHLGSAIDVVTIRVPSNMPSVGANLYVMLANNIIAHNVELYGEEVLFSTSQNAQLRMSRIIYQTLGTFSLSFKRDGRLLQISLYYEAISYRDHAGLAKVEDNTGVDLGQLLCFFAFLAFFVLPFAGGLFYDISQARDTFSFLAVPLVFVNAHVVVLLIFDWPFEHWFNRLGDFFGSVLWAAMFTVFVFTFLINAVKQDVLLQLPVVAKVVPSCLLLMSCFLAFQMLVATPRIRRKKTYIATLYRSMFEIRSEVGSDLEAFLSNHREHRNFLANAVDYVQYIRGMMQSASE